MDNYKFFQREKTPEATARTLDCLKSKRIRAFAEEDLINGMGYLINVHEVDMDEANRVSSEALHLEDNNAPPKHRVETRQIDETILTHMTKTWISADRVIEMSCFELGAHTDCESRLSYLIEQGIIEHKGNRSDLSDCDIRVTTKSLTAICIWNSDKIDQYIHPQSLVSADFYVDKERLIAYLDSGEVFQSWLGDTDCRLGCGEEDLATSDLTDGVWLWPQSLSHYIEAHDVVLPDAFLSHVKKNNWKVPYVCLAESTSEDDTFWIDYCDTVRLKRKAV